eukprot:TRINITY_DN14289_c0_g1_i1.p1 TRINITY_DN14289_c0_g1~~TRINITY_DN14289_c0_g1_i1.p1  ORF type:complete len:1295 (-),score=88.49 TRINITY_DN14289_c0_g1_i1:31-3585(-)
MDLLLVSNGDQGIPFVNTTKVRELTRNNSLVSGVSPRWLMNGLVFDSLEKDAINATALFLLIDSKTEHQIPIGREWNPAHRPLGRQELHLQESLARRLGVQPNAGERVYISFNLTRFLDQAGLVNFDDGDSGAQDQISGFVEDALESAFGIDFDEPIDVDIEGLLTALGFDSNYPWGLPSAVEFSEDQVVNFVDGLGLGNITISNVQDSAPDGLLSGLQPLNQSFQVGNISTGNVLEDGLDLIQSGLDLLNASTVTDLVRQAFDLANPNATFRVDRDAFLDQFGLGPDTSGLPFVGNTIQISPRALLNLEVTDSLTGNNATLLSTALSFFLDLKLEYTVVDGIGTPEGKYPSALGNVIVLDSSHFLNGIVNSLCYDRVAEIVNRFVPNVTIPNAKELVKNIPIDDFSLFATIMYRDRRKAYTASDNARDDMLVEFSNSVFYDLLPDFPANAEAPVAITMVAYSFFRLFLDQIFNATIFIMVILTSILMYSLLLTNADEKTYEYGMLRALGLRNTNLMNLITYQALWFSIPGVAIALFLSFLFNILLEEILSPMTGYAPSYTTIATTAIVVPLFLGFVLPLVSNIVPIQHALGKSLRDSLDVYHQAFAETTVVVTKLEDLGLAPWQTAVAVIMVVSGFTVYYLIPLSFIFNNLVLFFTILNVILLSMLVGLCMITQSLQTVMQSGVLWCIVWFNDRKMLSLIKKNLHGHTKRTTPIFLMFTISVASIIFGGVTFSLQAQGLMQNIELLVGADVRAETFDADYSIPNIDPWLTEQKNEGVVTDWTYVTIAFDDHPHIWDAEVSDLVDFSAQPLNLYGVQRNYLDVTYSKYMLHTDLASDYSFEKTESGTKNSIAALYDQELTQGNYVPENIRNGIPRWRYNVTTTLDQTELIYQKAFPVILTAAAKKILSLTTDTFVQLKYKVGINHDAEVVTFEQLLDRRFSRFIPRWAARSIALAYKIPGFVSSSYELSLPFAPVLVRIEDFDFLLGHASQRSGWPLSRLNGILLVRLHDDATTEQTEHFYNTLRAFMDPDRNFITNTKELLGSTEAATGGIIFFFIFVSVLQMTLDFFMLWLGFTANVKNNAWEFGVLRSLGLPVNAAIRAYIYEAVTLVLSSFILGTLVGLTIAITLQMQFNLFFELPLKFDFPFPLFISTLLLALLAAVAGSYYPARHLKRKAISGVLKGQ